MLNTKYNQIVDIDKIATADSKIDMATLIAYAKKESSIPVNTKKTLLLAIDMQNDFMEGIGSLPVSGSAKDIQRLTKWIYNNLPHLTHIMCSLDTHSIRQIFHADWWRDENDMPPPPFTIIRYQDVLTGKWRPTANEYERSLSYLQHLEDSKKNNLCIWPYHCIENTYGHQLENEFTKMVYFHAAAHRCSPLFITKGQDPRTEMYGIIKPEYTPEDYVNNIVLDTLSQYDDIYIAGEASSHCVLASVEQILDFYGDNTDMTSRFTILEDCMSPIEGFEDVTTKRFRDLKEKYNIKIKKSTDVTL